MRHCPKCKTEVNSSAVVEVWPEPAGWQFYGKPGARFIRCRGNVNGRGYVHFVVNEDGRQYHRLAYGIEQMNDAPTPAAIQGTLL